MESTSIVCRRFSTIVALTSAAAALPILFCTAGVSVAEPLCGDVNDSGGVNTSDALLVLRKSVGQNVALPCNGFVDQYAQCSADLENASLCGNGTIDPGEDCDIGTIGGNDCQTIGQGNGQLFCAAGCVFDTSECSGSPCFPNPCQHGGSCSLFGEGYSCDCVGDWVGAVCQTCISNVEFCSTDPEYFRALFLSCAGAEGFKCQGAESDPGDCQSYCESYISCEGSLQINADGWTTVTGVDEPPNCPP